MTTESDVLRTLTACPFCLTQKAADAPVCPACNRDTLVPATLLQERDELLRHRDAMRAELDAKTKRLSAHRRFGRLAKG